MASKVLRSALLVAATATLVAAPLSAQGCPPGRTCAGAGVVSRAALIVGISKYKNLPADQQLNFADADANAFAAFLQSEAGGAWRPEQMRMLLNDSATASKIVNGLKWLKTAAAPGGEVIIYFAGHAATETDMFAEEDHAFLLAHDVHAQGNYRFGAGIEFELINNAVAYFAKRNIRVLLVTDACRSGKLLDSSDREKAAAAALANYPSLEMVTRYASSKGGELSHEHRMFGGGHGVFTYYLLHGWRGAAADPVDGTVTAERLGRFVQDSVKKRVQPEKQTPQHYAGNDELTMATVTPDQMKQVMAELLQLKPPSGELPMLASRALEVKPLELTPALRAHYEAFYQALHAGRVEPGQPGSAWASYESVLQDSSQAELAMIMRFALTEALSKRVEPAINRYLDGGNDLPAHEVFARAARDVALMRTIAEDSAEEVRLHANQLFFEAYAVLRRQERPRYPEAMRKLEQAAALLPDAAYVQNALGTAYLDLHQFDAAEEAVTKAIELAPAWTYPRNLLGAIRFAQRRYAHALQAYASALRLDSAAYYALNNIGNVYWHLGRYQQAEAFYRRSIAADSTKSLGYANLANLYRTKHRLTDAASAIGTALRLDEQSTDRPYWIWPQVVHGLVQHDLSKYARAAEGEAEQILSAAAAQAPFDPEPLTALGDLYREQKKYAEAEAMYERAIELDAGYSQAYSGLAWVRVAQQQPAVAEQLHQVAIRNASHPAQPLARYGELLLWQARNGGADTRALLIRADSAYRAALRADSLELGWYAELADVQIARGQPAEAEKWYRAAERVGSMAISGSETARSPIPATQLGVYFYQQGRADSALVAFRRAIDIDSTYPDARNHLALLLFERSEYTEGAQQLRAAARLGFQSDGMSARKYVPTLRAAASRLLAQNELQALELYEAALDLDARNHALRHELAAVHYRAGRFGEAAQLLAEVLRLAEAEAASPSVMHTYLATYALVALEQGTARDARVRLDRVTGAAPPATQLAHALVLLELGDAEAALAKYREAVRRNAGLANAEYLQQRYAAATLRRIAALQARAQ